MHSLFVTLRRGLAGRPHFHLRILEALGLHKRHQCVEKPNNESIRGMLAKVGSFKLSLPNILAHDSKQLCNSIHALGQACHACIFDNAVPCTARTPLWWGLVCWGRLTQKEGSPHTTHGELFRNRSPARTPRMGLGLENRVRCQGSPCA